MHIRSLSTLLKTGTALAVLSTGSLATYSQQTEETAIRQRINITEADTHAAASVKGSAFHVMAAGLPGAREEAAKLNHQVLSQQLRSSTEFETVPRKSAAVLAAPYFYPGDLAKGTGVTMPSTVTHAIYVNYTGTIASNWGNPEGFLADLGKSSFIHLTDQYTGGSPTTARYTVGPNASVKYSLYGNTLYEHELWAIVHAVAKVRGTGLGHLYNVFLPQGLDTCFEQSHACYSPDNYSNFYFCAYHSWVQFSDIGRVYFSVEPFQQVQGCQVSTPSPNGQLADSTNSVLSHEFFETITDPDVGSGYINRIDLDLRGYEIGDECQPLGNSTGNLSPTFLINAKKYEVQTEYSNTYHACAVQP